jgi:hypothetical protein
MAAWAWVAAYSLTGIDTMPKVTVKEASARAAMRASSGPKQPGRTDNVAKMPPNLQLNTLLASVLSDGLLPF